MKDYSWFLMGYLRYSIYCDESGIDNKSGFFFGALYCSPRRAEILRDKIKLFRAQFGCSKEMKWTKVSSKMLNAYIEFVNIFFEDPYAVFYVRLVKREKCWIKWAPTEEERFFKSYYWFLRSKINSSARYGIFLDYKPGKRYRWKSLHFAINKSIVRDCYPAHKEQVHTLKAVDSKDEDLIQLVDVLLGAMTSSATGEAKVSLANYVRMRKDNEAKSGQPKIKSDEFVGGKYSVTD